VITFNEVNYKKFSKKYANSNWPIKNMGHFFDETSSLNQTYIFHSSSDDKMSIVCSAG